MTKSKIHTTALSDLLYKSFNANDRLEFSQIFAGKIPELIDSDDINEITLPVTDQMQQLAEDGRLAEYFSYLSNARSYLYRHHLDGPRPPYFKVSANPDLSAYVPVGNNSFEVADDNTLFARMEEGSLK